MRHRPQQESLCWLCGFWPPISGLGRAGRSGVNSGLLHAQKNDACKLYARLALFLGLQALVRGDLARQRPEATPVALKGLLKKRWLLNATKSPVFFLIFEDLVRAPGNGYLLSQETRSDRGSKSPSPPSKSSAIWPACMRGRSFPDVPR